MIGPSNGFMWAHLITEGTPNWLIAFLVGFAALFFGWLFWNGGAVERVMRGIKQ